MGDADLLIQKKLRLGDDQVVDIPERPYLVRPGAAQGILVRPLDELFRIADPALVIGFEPNGNVYWHRATRAEVDALRAMPGAEVGADHALWGKKMPVSVKSGSPAAGRMLMTMRLPVRVHLFYNTVVAPGDEDSATYTVPVDVDFRIVRDVPGGQAPDVEDSPPETSDLAPRPSPQEPPAAVPRLLPPPQSKTQRRQNKAIYHAIQTMRGLRLRLDSGVVVPLSRLLATHVQTHPDRRAFLYILALDDDFRPIRPPEADGRMLVFGVRAHELVHFEWIDDDTWAEIRDSPAAVRDGTLVQLNAGPNSFDTYRMQIVTPLASDMRAVVSLRLQVRLDPETYDAAAALGPHVLAPATLYFPAALERNRSAFDRFNRRLRGIPHHHTRLLFAAERPPGPHELGDLSVVLPLSESLLGGSLDEMLAEVRALFTPRAIGRTAYIEGVSAAYLADADTHVFVMADGEERVVSPFVFYGVLACSGAFVRRGGMWVWQPPAPPTSDVKRLRTRAPADDAVREWEDMARAVFDERVGDLEPLLDLLALGATQMDGTCLLVGMDGGRRVVDPVVYHAVFLDPAECADPFVGTTVAWIRDSLRAEMDTRAQNTLVFPPPIGEVRTRPWSSR